MHLVTFILMFEEFALIWQLMWFCDDVIQILIFVDFFVEYLLELVHIHPTISSRK